MPENIQMICLVRLIVAAVCGLLIGVERQTRMKGAGSRTHMMVSLGAALMTLVSSYWFRRARMRWAAGRCFTRQTVVLYIRWSADNDRWHQAALSVGCPLELPHGAKNAGYRAPWSV